MQHSGAYHPFQVFISNIVFLIWRIFSYTVQQVLTRVVISSILTSVSPLTWCNHLHMELCSISLGQKIPHLSISQLIRVEYLLSLNLFLLDRLPSVLGSNLAELCRVSRSMNCVGNVCGTLSLDYSCASISGGSTETWARHANSRQAAAERFRGFNGRSWHLVYSTRSAKFIYPVSDHYEWKRVLNALFRHWKSELIDSQANARKSWGKLQVHGAREQRYALTGNQTSNLYNHDLILFCRQRNWLHKARQNLGLDSKKLRFD